MRCLLNLIIYTTGMRNSESIRIRVKDIISIGEHHYIDIQSSKTENGVRIVPLHPFVYEKLTQYIEQNSKRDEDLVFETSQYSYNEANLEMGRLLGKTPEELKALHITYYSGRAFWKTMMNIEKLGDVEEYFMGHRVSSDVAKLYNHKDKIGRKNLLAKTREAIKILDKYLFTSCTTVSPPPRQPLEKSGKPHDP